MSSNYQEHVTNQPERLLDYLDGTLLPSERTAVERHLAECADCRRRVQDQRAVRTLLSEYTAVEPPPALENRIFEALDADQARSPVAQPRPAASPAGREPGRLRSWAERWRLRPQVLVPLAAALLLVAVGAGELGDYLAESDDMEQAAQTEAATDTVAAAPAGEVDGGGRASDGESTGEAPAGGEGQAPQEEPGAGDATLPDQGASADDQQADGGNTSGLMGITASTARKNPAGDIQVPPSVTPILTLQAGDVLGMLYQVPSAQAAVQKLGTLLGLSPQPAYDQSAPADDTAPGTLTPETEGELAHVPFLLWTEAERVSLLLERVEESGYHPNITVQEFSDLPPEMRGAAEGAPVISVLPDGSLSRVSDRAGSAEAQEDLGRVLVMMQMP